MYSASLHARFITGSVLKQFFVTIVVSIHLNTGLKLDMIGSSTGFNTNTYTFMLYHL